MGKLASFPIGTMIVVKEEEVLQYRRQAVGRPRLTVPVWHQPVPQNAQYLTSITVTLHGGSDERLRVILAAMRE